MFEFILMSADRSVEQFIFSTWTSLIASSLPWLTSLLIIFVAIVGYLLWMGRIELSRSELLTRLLQMTVIFVFVTHIDVLDRFVYRVATDVPGAIASSMVAATGLASGSVNQTLDEIFVNGVKIGGRVLDQAGVTDFGTVLLGFLIIAVVLIALIPVAFVLMLSKLAVGVLLGLAPFVLPLYLFTATRGLFEGYVRQLLGFALIPTMIYALLGLVLGMVNTVSAALVNESSTGVPAISTVAPYVLVLLVVGFLSLQVVSWSSGIAGSLALSTQGALASALSAANPALRRVKAALRALEPRLRRSGPERSGQDVQRRARRGDSRPRPRPAGATPERV